ncbi:MAG TPA: choice-of-anchor D domain-containing protein [Casimicrobiaceae bacterium]|nr:choice-of-anchor D domain-containing protein [Casimicrobiaceae bacterium]
MKLRRACGWILALATLAGAGETLASARFCTDANTLSFGNQAVATSRTQSVAVRNCGDAAWTFTDVSVHPATAAAYDVMTTCATGLTLAPGETCSASVTFAPTAPGQVSGGLWLRNTTSDADAFLAFYGRGVDAQAGTATLAFEPAVANFSTVDVGQSAAMPLQIVNQGPAAMTLTAIVLNGPQAYDFSGDEISCVVGVTLAAGAACDIMLHFMPQVAGPRAAFLVIDSPQLASLAILDIDGVGASPATPAKVTIVEYRNAALDHYFITSLADEIALCDAGQSPCTGWVRTGESFNAYADTGDAAGAVGVCRFFNDSYAHSSSHFYALHGLGCEDTLAKFPDWKLESGDVFAMGAPDTAGACVNGTTPVFRLYNNGAGGAPAHRFTVDPAIRAQMIEAGWTPEGYGIGVAFCAPI